MSAFDIENGVLTNDNETIVVQSLRYRLLTAVGDIEMLPTYGTDLYNYRGRRFTTQIISEIANQVTTAITGFGQPIVNISTIEIEPTADGILDILINGEHQLLVQI